MWSPHIMRYEVVRSLSPANLYAGIIPASSISNSWVSLCLILIFVVARVFVSITRLFSVMILSWWHW